MPAFTPAERIRIAEEAEAMRALLRSAGPTGYSQFEEIGAGGYGRVVRCELRGKSAAMKLLNVDDESEKRRFRREVRLLTELTHPNIIRIAASDLDTEPFRYVMPLYKTSLDRFVASITVTPERIVPILTKVLAGLRYAHSHGVVHRDLKPQNILLNSESDVVVSDFGHALDINSESTRITRSGFAMGTFMYMAPEQFQNPRNVDHRADIYSFGRVMYHALTGPLSFAVQDTSNLPANLAAVIDKCTRPAAEDRFQNIADLSHALSLPPDSSKEVEWKPRDKNWLDMLDERW